MRSRVAVGASLLIVVAACTGGSDSAGSASARSSASQPGAPPASAPTTSAAPTAASSPTSTDVGSAPADQPTPVIVDYSPTVSDVAGLMYLLAHDDVDVIAVSLPTTGEAGCELGAEVTFRVLALYDRPDVPVACGPDVPDARSWPDAFLAGQENLSFALPRVDRQIEPDAGDLIARVADESAVPPVVWAVAPLTNVADALERHPGFAEDIDRIVIMGGAVDVPGNVQGTPAEWNLWIDVPAAASVLGAELPITLVPLDATNDVPVPVWYGRVLEGAEQSPGIAHLRRLERAFPAVSSGFFFLWDELAATVVAGEELVTTDDRNILVVTGGAEDGRTREDPGGRTITVATGVPDPDTFYEHFLATLAGAPVEIGGDATPEESAYFRDLEVAIASTAMAADELDDWLRSLDAYDPGAMVERMGPVLAAVAGDLPAIRSITPPSDLEDAHSEFVEGAAWLVDSQQEIVDLLESATTFEELGPLFVRFDEPCGAVLAEAAVRGLDVDLPCG